LATFVRMAMRKWTPSNRSYGMTVRRGRRVSLMGSRSLLVGFPLREGKVCVCVCVNLVSS
jgi:hypothetical protein